MVELFCGCLLDLDFMAFLMLVVSNSLAQWCDGLFRLLFRFETDWTVCALHLKHGS